ncbi:MAG: hypothetical protein AAFZ63_19245, partial [Bacteroidota bacterium]
TLAESHWFGLREKGIIGGDWALTFVFCEDVVRVTHGQARVARGWYSLALVGVAHCRSRG